MNDNSNVLEQIKGGLIVSCQARRGWPMYGKDIMAAFSVAAQQGGACGIRANEVENIKEIKKYVNIPIIGINKQWFSDSDVYITPTFQSAVEIIEAGSDIVALDATKRKRPNNEKLPNIIREIKKKSPEIIIMGDIATFDDAAYADSSGCDLVATTLVGYTESTNDIKNVNLSLINDIYTRLTIPVIAEGRIKTPADARKAIDYGAHSVVVGTMITRPEIITNYFVDTIKGGD